MISPKIHKAQGDYTFFVGGSRHATPVIWRMNNVTGHRTVLNIFSKGKWQHSVNKEEFFYGREPKSWNDVMEIVLSITARGLDYERKSRKNI